MIRDVFMETVAASVLVAAVTLPVTCVSLPSIEADPSRSWPWVAHTR
jgi:hypothetical protein